MAEGSTTNFRYRRTVWESMRVVGAVFLDGDRVLAFRRSPTRPAGGKWEFPGGKVEAGESPTEALSRELQEELGVHVHVGQLLDRTTTEVDGVQIDLACYIVDALDGLPISSSDHDQIRWISRHQIRDLEWAIPDLPAVKKLSPTS